MALHNTNSNHSLQQKNKPYQWPGKTREAWSIGIYRGPTPFKLSPDLSVENPVLTCYDISDAQASFIADPFIVFENEQFYLFFEIKNEDSGRGEIALATSEDGLHWHYQQVVLKKDFHLSYSYVFKEQGQYFMVLETLGANAVQLYRSAEFPLKWEYVSDLISGQHADPTIFYHEKKWWMFTCPRPYQHDILHLYFSDALTGPWESHPLNPIIDKNPSGARPGGRPVFYQGHWYRFAQDCAEYYGKQVRAFRINKLSIRDYHETEIEESPILSNSGEGWNGKGMHHVDALQLKDTSWLAAVDGIFLNE